MWRVLQEAIDGTGNALSELGVYLAGRGIISATALIAGFLMGGAASTPVVAGVLALGVAVGGFMRLREMRQNLDSMARIYAPEIAEQLGIEPEQVTRAHVHNLAYGDPARGIPPNPILREEIDREWSKTWLNFGAAIASAAVTFLGVSWFNLNETITKTLAESTVTGGMMKAAPWLVGSGVGLVGAISSLVVHNGIDLGIKTFSALGRVTLHDRILKLERDIHKGKSVSKEQVFALYAAANPQLSESIRQRFGADFDYLPTDAKARAIEAMGVGEQMQKIAADLSSGAISAGNLAFIIAAPHEASAPPAPPIAVPDAPQPAPVRVRSDFVERLGPRTAQTNLTHAEREDLRSEAHALEALVR